LFSIIWYLLDLLASKGMMNTAILEPSRILEFHDKLMQVSIAEDSSVITSTLIAFSTFGLLIVIIAMSSGRRSICI
jgi:CHASE3 domain sensor protein